MVSSCPTAATPGAAVADEASQALLVPVTVQASTEASGLVSPTAQPSPFQFEIPVPARSGRHSHRALDPSERQSVVQILHDERFVDKAPAEIFATLLDEGVYHCSIRTMYRILEDKDEVRERRDVLRHPKCRKPELVATGPNQVWSWDITKLRGPVKWCLFSLYVILDIFSRYVVGWRVEECESDELARELIEESCRKQAIVPDQLILHADRGGPMKAKTVTQLLADLGVGKSHSRPHVSDDNPFSEAHFKTLKYRPEFPDRFGSLQDARLFGRQFFPWYNDAHHHSGIGLLTPKVVHYGLAPRVIENRRLVLQRAYAAHPERFVRRVPQPPELPPAVWINPPGGSRPKSSATSADPEHLS